MRREGAMEETLNRKIAEIEQLNKLVCTIIALCMEINISMLICKRPLFYNLLFWFSYINTGRKENVMLFYNEVAKRKLQGLRN